MAKKKGGKGSALSKPVKISTKLAGVIGKGPMPRTHVTKKIWAYIKKNKLQHKDYGVLIKLDSKLKTILKPSKKFKKKGKMVNAPAGYVWMMDMTKQLNKHIESSKVKVNPSGYDYDYDEDEDEYDTYENPEYDDDEDDEDEDEDDYDTYDNPDYDDDDDEYDDDEDDDEYDDDDY